MGRFAAFSQALKILEWQNGECAGGREGERESSESAVEQINHQVKLPIFGQHGDSTVKRFQTSATQDLLPDKMVPLYKQAAEIISRIVA